MTHLLGFDIVSIALIDNANAELTDNDITFVVTVVSCAPSLQCSRTIQAAFTGSNKKAISEDMAFLYSVL
jgi:hypothetical protein